MLDLTEEMLRELVQIKWALICLVTMYWGKCLYTLALGWLGKKKKLSTLEQMNRDLAGSVRSKQDCPESEWD